jgi:hypothetical protein
VLILNYKHVRTAGFRVQGLVLARGPVAEQMHEYSYVKIPHIVGAEICVLFRVSILASLVLTLLLNTFAQFTLLHIICLVFYNRKLKINPFFAQNRRAPVISFTGLVQ